MTGFPLWLSYGKDDISMAKNSNLHNARNTKDDEFYTQISDIEKELKHYKEYFKNAVVLCNCDDPEWSNFWRYFHLNFEHLGLKKLITTHYDVSEPTYKMEYEGGNDNDVTVGDITPLKTNGDFRSPECIALLQEATIVVTNPPFSLFRQYVAQLMEYNKSFIIIGNQNALTGKEVFSYLRDNKMWLGYHSGDMAFRVPDDSEPRETRFWIDENGKKWRSLGNACWYTNLDISKRHEPIDLIEKYDAEKYPKFDNYNAINVNKTLSIPYDYDGVMGVPVTMLQYHCPEQFEIIGHTHSGDDDIRVEELRTDTKNRHRGLINGKQIYDRILIRRKEGTKNAD